MAIAHRSVMLESFGCAGLVFTTIVQFVWDAYALVLLGA